MPWDWAIEAVFNKAMGNTMASKGVCPHSRIIEQLSGEVYWLVEGRSNAG